MVWDGQRPRKIDVYIVFGIASSCTLVELFSTRPPFLVGRVTWKRFILLSYFLLFLSLYILLDVPTRLFCVTNLIEYKIFKYRNEFLKPVVMNLPSFVKDTNVLKLMENFQFLEENAHLFTMDIKGFYTNIPNDYGFNELFPKKT